MTAGATFLQTLRVWRNASEHNDTNRWASDGPKSLAAASQHLTSLKEAIDALVSQGEEEARGPEGPSPPPPGSSDA